MAEDEWRRPHILGSGIEGGVDSRRASGIVLDPEDYVDFFDYSDGEEDEQDPQPQAQPQAQPQKLAEEPAPEPSEKRQVVVNDYGFILKGAEVEMAQVHLDPLRRAATISLIGDATATVESAFLSEHDRKRVTKKQQEQTRVDELKWVQALSQQPDQVKKSNKVTFGGKVD